MQTQKSLSEILHGKRDDLQRAWESTEAAADFAPMPSGQYVCRVVSGELFKAKTGTPGYKLTFRVLEGEHAGRLIWHDIWLTPHALPMAKRDVAKLGVTALAQLEQPLPRGMRAMVTLALRRDDDGTEYNRVRTFEITGIDETEADPFAPSDLTPDSNATTPGEIHYEAEQAELIAPDEPTKVVRYE